MSEFRYRVLSGSYNDKAHKYLNRALNCNLKNINDIYIDKDYKLVLGGDCVYIYFKELNFNFIKNLVAKINYALACENEYWRIYDVQTDTDIEVIDDLDNNNRY